VLLCRLLIFKLCLNISKATNQVTLPQLINEVDKQGPLVTKLPAGLLCYREIRPLQFVPKGPSYLLTKMIRLLAEAFFCKKPPKLVGKI